MTVYKSINPYTGELLKEFSTHKDKEISNELSQLEETFTHWRVKNIRARLDFVDDVRNRLEQKKEELATLITCEMGKPITEARAEIDKCVVLCDYYLNTSEGFLKPQKRITCDGVAEIIHQPLGVLLAIMPWNFPFWQVFRFIIPNLIAGNVCVLKHAPNVPQCALAIEDLFKSKEKVLSNLFLTNEQVAHLIKSEEVKGVTLTGSNRAGRVIGKLAGENVKKTVLELGGNDAFVVLKDADIDKATDKLLKSRFLNTGQSCIGAKRLIIASEIKKEFVKLFIEKITKLIVIGNPIDESITLGVIARDDLRASLQGQVEQLLTQGGQVLYRGEAEVSSNSFPVTIIDTTQLTSKERDIELFGPVLQVIVFDNEKEVITFVNGTVFGLGCSIWSDDIKKAKQMSLLIDTGSVFINEMVFSAPSLPFGGVKKSGVGRELAKEGLIEFTNIKSVYLKSN